MNSLSPITQLCLANEKSKAGLYPARGARPGGAGGRAALLGPAPRLDSSGPVRVRAAPGCGGRGGRGPAPRLQDGWRRLRRQRREGGRAALSFDLFLCLLLQSFPEGRLEGWVFTLFPPGLQLRSSPRRPRRAGQKGSQEPPAEREGLPASRPRRPGPVPSVPSQLYFLSTSHG